MRKKILMFTDGFPWAKAEIPFISNELAVLSEVFDIEIVARIKRDYQDNPILVQLPQGVKLHKYIIEEVARKEKMRALGYALSTRAFYEELIKWIKYDRSKTVFSEMYSYITYTYLFSAWLKHEIDLQGVDIYYTYWNSFATLALAIDKCKYSQSKLITRTHRYDLYNERTIYYRQYFKGYVDSKLDKVLFIAEHGKKYYMEHFAESDSDKYVINMIGVTAAKKIPTAENTDVINIVSCSNVIAVKRVDLIVRALSRIDDIRINWVHMGGGILFNELQELCERELSAKSNITYELKGYVPNTEVREYYESHYVDFFITTSASEGSPVSIQEALAYGIPILGTDVGEVAVLAAENGMVLCEDPNVGEISEAIRSMCLVNADEKEKMRKRAFKKWKDEYDVIKNAEEFRDMLLRMD